MTKPTYFKPDHKLTFATVKDQRARFVALLAAEPDVEQIHCDLMAVRLCDSAGLAFLIDARRLCQAKDVQLIIENPSADMLALAKLYGIEKIIDNDEE